MVRYFLVARKQYTHWEESGLRIGPAAAQVQAVATRTQNAMYSRFHLVDGGTPSEPVGVSCSQSTAPS